MNLTRPMVTLLIATKNRWPELARTLSEMRRQQYPSMDMLVIDDGSEQGAAPPIEELWPGGTLIRHHESRGQCARRNEGFILARGEFVLQLDDDCHLLNTSALTRAVEILEGDPKAGAVTFFIVNSPLLPDGLDTSHMSGGCVASFMGAAVLFRKTALSETEGYRAFFGNEWEEEELGLQLLKRGWKIIFAPQIVAHHRLSSLNRNSPRTWMRGLRNRSWAMVIHMPVQRILPEMGWKMLLGVWDAIRLLRIRLFFQATSQMIAGLPAAYRLRHPLSPLALRRYDQLRANAVITHEQFDSPVGLSLQNLRGFWMRWRNRARNASVWDKQGSDIGSSSTVLYAHEVDMKSPHPAEKKTA